MIESVDEKYSKIAQPGWGGLVGIGISSRITKGQTSEEEFKRLEKAPEVQSVLTELGLNRVQNTGNAETTDINGESISLKTFEFNSTTELF